MKKSIILSMGILFALSNSCNIQATKSYRPTERPSVDEFTLYRKGMVPAELKYDSQEDLYYFGKTSSFQPAAESSPLMTETPNGLVCTLNDDRESLPQMFFSRERPSSIILSLDQALKKKLSNSPVFNTVAAGLLGMGIGNLLFSSNPYAMSLSSIAIIAAMQGTSSISRLLRGDNSESVLGTTDRRIRISEDDCKEWPYVVHGHMRMNYTSGERKGLTYIGSGTLIHNEFVLTAAHNLYKRGTGLMPGTVTFHPGRFGETFPWSAQGNQMIIHPQYKESPTNSEARNADIALLKLNKPLGRDLGFFGYSSDVFNDKSLGVDVNITGYPGGEKGGRHLYTMKGATTKHNEHTVLYDIDTSAGQSGSGVWSSDEDDNYTCHAVHAYGCGSSLFKRLTSSYNSGTRITAEKIEFIEQHLK